jgi:hypothetical protein
MALATESVPFLEKERLSTCIGTLSAVPLSFVDIVQVLYVSDDRCVEMLCLKSRRVPLLVS